MNQLLKNIAGLGRAGIAVAIAALALSAVGAYATVDKITSKEIAKNAVKSKHVKGNGLTGNDIKDGSLADADFAGGLPQGERGPQGPTGPQGPAGEDGASVFSGSVPSGETVYGTLGSQRPLASGKRVREAYSFPIPAPVEVSGSSVNFAPDASGATDADPACTGTYLQPTAPPGKVCLYYGGASGVGAISGEGAGNRFGLIVEITSSGGNDDFVRLGGSWAYTAP